LLLENRSSTMICYAPKSSRILAEYSPFIPPPSIDRILNTCDSGLES
jgi:hypothetical protein